MKEIPLTKGYVTLVDDEDYDWLNQWKWHYNTRGYAKRTQTKPFRVEIAMHRLITNAPEGMEVDHINNNKLDNRKENLRIASHKNNTRNRRKLSNSDKKYKGVFMDRRCPYRPYFAQLVLNKKRINRGNFATQEEAARAYDELAKKHFGEFANLNFPDTAESVHS